MGKIYMSKSMFYKAAVICVIICLGTVWWFCDTNKELMEWNESSVGLEDEFVESGNGLAEQMEEERYEDSTKEEQSIAMYGVHVTGAVKVPDQILYLQEGTRVGDAIKAAGGATEEADLSQMNLAGYIQDGQRIYVPVLGENLINIENTQVENRENLLTNINLATKIELLNLPGIGETYAERIIQHREENGPFETVEDIMEVKGIGESKFNDLKDKITVE